MSSGRGAEDALHQNSADSCQEGTPQLNSTPLGTTPETTNELSGPLGSSRNLVFVGSLVDVPGVRVMLCTSKP